MAVAVLQRRFTQRISLDYLLRPSALPGMALRDRLLLKEIVDGVLRHLLLLDHWIGGVSSRPPARVDPTVLWILRTAVYQLHFMRVPTYAAVNEATGLCSQLGQGRSRGFVNGVLRGFLRASPAPPEGDSPQALSVQFSHPLWLVERLLNRLGPDRAREWMEENNRRPEPIVWVNPFKLSFEDFCRRLQEEGIAHNEIPGLPGACRVETTGFVRHPLYRQGACFFMDADSQAVAGLASVQGVKFAADFCAAPGGKSFVLRSRLDPRADLVCSDLSWSRLASMKERAQFLGIGGLQCLQADASRALPFDSAFDLVLLDVPCSGLGTLRSNPEARWFVREADLEGYQERQLRILRNGFHAARRGGSVLYSTCSTEPEENDHIVQRFLDETPSATVEGDLFRGLGASGGTGRYFAARIRRTEKTCAKLNL